MTDTICKRCGEKYDWKNIESPENPSIYWVPHCPSCNAKQTANAVTDSWMEIIGSDLDNEHENYEYFRRRVHYHARLNHGRLSGLSVDELIQRAQYFDDNVSEGRRWGPQHDRDVAFTVRKQARRKAMNTDN